VPSNLLTPPTPEELEKLRKKQVPAKKEKKVSSPLKAALSGAAQGASLGFADEGVAAVAALKDVLLSDRWDMKDFKDLYKIYARRSREDDQKKSDAHPLAYGAAEFVGALSLPSPLGMKKALGLGAAAGVGYSEKSQGLKSLAGSAALGASSVPVGRFLGHLLEKTPKVFAYLVQAPGAMSDYLATRLAQKAVGLNKSQINALSKEAQKYGVKKSKQELTADLARNLLKNKMIPVFGSAADTVRLVQKLKDKSGKFIGKTINDLDAHGGLEFQGKQLIEEESQIFIKKHFMLPNSKIDPDKLTSLEDVQKKLIPSLLGRIDPEDKSFASAMKLKLLVQNKINEAKNTLSRTPEGFNRVNLLDRFYKAITEQIDQTIATASSLLKNQSKLTEEFKRHKILYGTASKALKSLEDKIAAAEGNRFISLTDIVAGGAGASAGGLQNAGLTVLGKKLLEEYGPNLGANSLHKLSNLDKKYNLLRKHAAKPMEALTELLERAKLKKGVETQTRLWATDPNNHITKKDGMDEARRQSKAARQKKKSILNQLIRTQP